MKSTSQSIPDGQERSGDKSTGTSREVRWVVVKRTPGITVAEIYVGHLQSEGIPARAWQEGAGEALGLMVGLLGTAHVVVPEEYVDQAQAILAAAEEDFEAGYEADEEE